MQYRLEPTVPLSSPLSLGQSSPKPLSRYAVSSKRPAYLCGQFYNVLHRHQYHLYERKQHESMYTVFFLSWDLSSSQRLPHYTLSWTRMCIPGAYEREHWRERFFVQLHLHWELAFCSILCAIFCFSACMLCARVAGIQTEVAAV
jgi:hypothetical protein